jgi:hypothetical protein
VSGRDNIEQALLDARDVWTADLRVCGHFEAEPQARTALDWGDLDELGFIFGANDRLTELGAAGVAPGLVSVPTTHKRSVLHKVRLSAQAEALRDFHAHTVPIGRWSLHDGQRRFHVESWRERGEDDASFCPDPDLNRMARLRRSVGFAARAQRVGAAHARATEVLMVTSTYRDGAEWEPGHIRSLLTSMRNWHTRRGLKFRYVWVAEIQDGKRREDKEGRGAIHYHIALWVPVGTRLPFADTQGWWPHGSTRTEVARGAVQYLMHYLKKGDSKNFSQLPKGARTHGCGGLDRAMQRAKRWLSLPGFIQGNSSIYDDWRRAPGGGWVSPAKQHFPSEFRRFVIAGRTALERVCRHARSIEASGPFSWVTDGHRALVFNIAGVLT